MEDLNQKATAKEDQVTTTIANEEALKQKEADEFPNPNVTMNLDNVPKKAAITELRSEFVGFPPKHRRDRKNDQAAREAAPVYLNVYDLAPTINGYVYWAGLGAFHSGVEVQGVEYADGKHDKPTSRVFEVEPRQHLRYKFMRLIFVGTTTLEPKQVREASSCRELLWEGL
ncbi:unnamed protein product [Linum tenue]|uniref:PPPDE domain-containing protein n=1 Tax=Linum tenue TaxID=586396 RepID=A0AAV0KCN2_9ROSI|nr:unnamed protein product [Linum tenue]